MGGEYQPKPDFYMASLTEVRKMIYGLREKVMQ
jgi:hypothetical protein